MNEKEMWKKEEKVVRGTAALKKNWSFLIPIPVSGDVETDWSSTKNENPRDGRTETGLQENWTGNRPKIASRESLRPDERTPTEERSIHGGVGGSKRTLQTGIHDGLQLDDGTQQRIIRIARELRQKGYLKVGFVGCEAGMNQRQKQLLTKMVIETQPAEFHHGDSIGADSEAHEIVIKHSVYTTIIIHPCEKEKKRAYKANTTAEGERVNVRSVQKTKERNRTVLNEVNLLIAAPQTTGEVTEKDETWDTYDQAKRMSKRIIKLLPEEEEEPKKNATK